MDLGPTESLRHFMVKACKMVEVYCKSAMNARGVAKFPINACVVYVGLTSGGDKILIVGPW